MNISKIVAGVVTLALVVSCATLDGGKKERGSVNAIVQAAPDYSQFDHLDWYASDIYDTIILKMALNEADLPKLKQAVKDLSALIETLRDRDAIADAKSALKSLQFYASKLEVALQVKADRLVQQKLNAAKDPRVAKNRQRFKELVVSLRTSLPSDFGVPVSALDKPCPFLDNRPLVTLFAMVELTNPGNYKIVIDGNEILFQVFSNGVDVTFRLLESKDAVNVAQVYDRKKAMDGAQTTYVRNVYSQALAVLAD